MTKSPVHCRELAVGYNGEAVLETLSFTVPEGETVSLVGRSGCGKTTLLKTLAGILPPLAGEATVLGSRLPAAPPAGTLGYIPQGHGLVPHESALTNVLHGRLSDLGILRSLLGRYPKDAVREARAAIEQVGLAGKEHSRVKELSGGQQRRVAIARAFVQEPDLLLADEMFSELDRETAQSIIRCLDSLQAETGMAVVIVEHNLEIAHEISDTVLALGEQGDEMPTEPARNRSSS